MKTDKSIIGCPHCGQTYLKDESPRPGGYCRVCRGRLVVGAVCSACERFVDPDMLDEDGYCEACREERRP